MRPVSTWKVEEVGEWFDENAAGLSAEGLARYKELFAEKGIDGFMLSCAPTTLPLTSRFSGRCCLLTICVTNMQRTIVTQIVLCMFELTRLWVVAGACRRRTSRTW